MPVTRSGKVSKPIDTSTKGLKKDIKDLVYKKISENTDEATLESYDQARKNYGKYSSNLDELQRRIGKVLEVDGKETSSRGANLISSMLNQKSNQTTKSLASAIEELDPSLNLLRESMIADLAMNASPSRGGLSFSDLASKNISKSAVKDEVVGKFISPVLEFFGAKNKDYTPAMLGEIAGDVISRKSGQAPMYNNALDYIPQFTTYGARPAQKEIGEFIFPYTLYFLIHKTRNYETNKLYSSTPAILRR